VEYYLDFIETTGCGLVDGLLGNNCRHSYGPFCPGISTPRWTPEKLKEYADVTYTYTGADGSKKTVDAPAAHELQRSLERHVRKWKRRVAVKQAADLDASAERTRLKQWRKRLIDFCEETGLRRQEFREKV